MTAIEVWYGRTSWKLLFLCVDPFIVEHPLDILVKSNFQHFVTRQCLHISCKVILTPSTHTVFFVSKCVYYQRLWWNIFVSKEACWRDDNYRHCHNWAHVPTKFIHCQISVEPHWSFNNTNITIQTQKCFSNVGVEMLVVTIQFTSVRMCVCLYGYFFVCFVHVQISAMYYMWNVYYWYAVTKDFCALLQRTFSVLTHKLNLVELPIVVIIANEGSILQINLREWVTVSCQSLS